MRHRDHREYGKMPGLEGLACMHNIDHIHSKIHGIRLQTEIGGVIQRKRAIYTIVARAAVLMI